MAQQQPTRRKTQIVETISIPDKLYFRIGDVSRLCGLPAYVLRFWETEFPHLKPNKGGTGQRLYRKRDVEVVLEIKRLLYDEGFTIAGARRLLAEKRRTHHAERDTVHAISTSIMDASISDATRKPNANARGPRLKELRKEMRELLTLLGPEEHGRERRPSLTQAKRDTKKTGRASDEPTLF